MAVYKFTAMDRVLEFVAPLLVEGKHSLGLRTIYKEFPWEHTIDYFEVTVTEIKENE